MLELAKNALTTHAEAAQFESLKQKVEELEEMPGLSSVGKARDQGKKNEHTAESNTMTKEDHKLARRGSIMRSTLNFWLCGNGIP